MSSGKQVLLHLLGEYSQKLKCNENLDEISEDLRIAFLLHGSTPPDMWFTAERMAWLSETELDGEAEYLGRQGLGIRGKNIFLSDLFGAIAQSEEIPSEVKQAFPDLTEEEYSSATQIIWLLLTALQWCESLSSIENNGKLDFEQMKGWLKGYRTALSEFRKDPGEWLGCEDDITKEELKKTLNNIPKM